MTFNQEELKQRQNLLRGWKPQPLHEITEESAQREREKKKEKVYLGRMDKYNTLKAKVLTRLDKAFDNVQKRERKAKSKPTAKNWQSVASAANTIYQIVDSSIYKLWEKHPDGYYHQGPGESISLEGIMADFDRDRMWKHMGLLENGRYHTHTRAQSTKNTLTLLRQPTTVGP